MLLLSSLLLPRWRRRRRRPTRAPRDAEGAATSLRRSRRRMAAVVFWEKVGGECGARGRRAGMGAGESRGRERVGGRRKMKTKTKARKTGDDELPPFRAAVACSRRSVCRQSANVAPWRKRRARGSEIRSWRCGETAHSPAAPSRARRPPRRVRVHASRDLLFFRGGPGHRKEANRRRNGFGNAGVSVGDGGAQALCM